MHSPIAHTSTILVLFLFLDYVYIIRIEFENRLTIFAFLNKIFAEYIRQNKYNFAAVLRPITTITINNFSYRQQEHI